MAQPAAMHGATRCHLPSAQILQAWLTEHQAWLLGHTPEQAAKQSMPEGRLQDKQQRFMLGGPCDWGAAV